MPFKMVNSCAVSGSSGCEGITGAAINGCGGDCDSRAAKFRVTTRIETTSKVSRILWSLPRWIDAMLILRHKVTAGRQIKAMAKFKGATLTTSIGRFESGTRSRSLRRRPENSRIRVRVETCYNYYPTFLVEGNILQAANRLYPETAIRKKIL